MLKNYFKIALRNLWRHRAFSFINILGLTVGMSACLLIFLYVRFELSYDSFHTKADRIYRVVADLKTPTEVLKESGPAWAVAPNIKNDFPEVESFVRLQSHSQQLRKGDIKFQEDYLWYADSSLFQVFDLLLLQGDPATALRDPFSIVLSETTARKYFGDANPMGQTLFVSVGAIPVKVTGVMKDMPQNAQFKAEVFISLTTISSKYDPDMDKEWSSYQAMAYLLLKPGTDANALEKKLPAFIKRKDGEEEKKLNLFVTLGLEPLRSVYLHSAYGGTNSGSISNVYIFSIIAVFILGIACINFVNLTTARSAERAKEVGIRKVAGALRGQLARQFIGESVLICLLAFGLTLVLVSLLIPPFNELAGKTVSTGVFEHPAYVGLTLAAAAGIGLLAGFYPAFVLSSFRPVSVLKGRFVTGAKGLILRKTLVTAQFTISIALIISTIVVYNQMNYMRNKDLGFNKDQMLVLATNGDTGAESFKQAITDIPGVQGITASSSIPGGGNMGAYSQIQNKAGEMQVANLDLYFVDWDYIPQYKMKMVAGRAFSRKFPSDTSQAIVLNESALKQFGYASAEQAIGRRFSQWGRDGQIIGVMKDFHFQSLQQPIRPLSMSVGSRNLNLVSVKLSGGQIPSSVAAIESQWKKFLPNRPFSYFFIDEFFDKQYSTEIQFGKLFINFAVLAIFISCLGLLGLAAYSTLQRTKEVGIRKTMGASVMSIVSLLSGDFLKLVILSFFIAGPIAWYFMHKWLDGFAYRTSVSWWIFGAAGTLAVLIAMVTISTQAIRAALANPVKSLRSE